MTAADGSPVDGPVEERLDEPHDDMHGDLHDDVDERGVPRTGDPQVDRALQTLRDISPQAGPAEQLDVLTTVHQSLQQRLSAAAE